MKIGDIKKAYFIGIKGSGMTAIAEILKKRGVEISGSDTAEVFFTDSILKRNNVAFFENFSTGNIPADADVIVYSTAYNSENNPEMAEAEKRELEMFSYPEMLGILFREKLGIAVCGTHGKTTTSAMLAEVLVEAGVKPSAIIGSQVISWQGSALYGEGEYFVAEADEYQNKLRFYDPWSVILTSVDWDHPDFFTNFESYKAVFKQFVIKIPKTGNLVVWGDSSEALEVADSANCNILTYGFGEDNDYHIENHTTQSIKGVAVQSFEIMHAGKSLGIFETPLSGKHNILNACAVIALCHSMKLDLEKVGQAVGKFQGTSRRFEKIGECNGAILIDDYAHHPDEIRATLEGARARFGEKNIWTVFHPHTFTRTKALLQEFSQSFDDTDRVIVIDIYGSAREQQGGVSSKDLVDLINKYNRGKAEYIPTINETADYLRERISANDVVITMGAGDVWKIAEKLKS